MTAYSKEKAKNRVELVKNTNSLKFSSVEFYPSIIQFSSVRGRVVLAFQSSK